MNLLYWKSCCDKIRVTRAHDLECNLNLPSGSIGSDCENSLQFYLEQSLVYFHLRFAQNLNLQFLNYPYHNYVGSFHFQVGSYLLIPQYQQQFIQYHEYIFSKHQQSWLSVACEFHLFVNFDFDLYCQLLILSLFVQLTQKKTFCQIAIESYWQAGLSYDCLQRFHKCFNCNQDELAKYSNLVHGYYYALLDRQLCFVNYLKQMDALNFLFLLCWLLIFSSRRCKTLDVLRSILSDPQKVSILELYGFQLDFSWINILQLNFDQLRFSYASLFCHVYGPVNDLKLHQLNLQSS